MRVAAKARRRLGEREVPFALHLRLQAHAERLHPAEQGESQDKKGHADNQEQVRRGPVVAESSEHPDGGTHYEAYVADLEEECWQTEDVLKSSYEYP